MRGLEKNVIRLFQNNGKIFLVALDHPQFFGPVAGLEKPLSVIERFSRSRADGFIINPGLFKLLEAESLARKKFVMRASVGGSRFSNYQDVHPATVSGETSLSMGADAVILMMILGENDVNSICSVALAIEDFHKFSLPVIVEILAADSKKTKDVDLVAAGARIAAEIGADIVKVFFTEDFELVVSNCPVPVILAGGSRNKDIIEVAQQAVNCGAAGFAFGRNIFQNDDPLTLIEKLDSVLRGR